MYEDITYELILERMLEKVPSNMDKREGSVIYDALAPAAIELQNMYLELDVILNETFADTATREYLIKRAAERGLSPSGATNAVLKGVFTPASLNIATGARFSCQNLNYAVTDKIKDGEYRLACETEGTTGNQYYGMLIPIDYIDGLKTAELTELLIPGEDEEDTEVFRKRYFDSFNSVAFGGNIADYEEKVNALPGVGGVKVYPVWNGGGTVKIVIIDSTYQKPTDTLVNDVQTAVDPIQNSGTGLGIAPIGHIVTVVGANETTINIDTEIAYETGWTWADIKENVEKAIDNYFTELGSEWDDSDNLVVRISQIETRLLNLSGVLDVSGTKLNNDGQNIVLDADNIPVRGVVQDIG